MFLAMLLGGTVFGRTWTNDQGKKIEADFVEANGEEVTILLTKNGKKFSIPIASLSAADQAYVKEQQSKTNTQDEEKNADVKKAAASGKKRGRRTAVAVSPNWDAPWPDRVEIDEAPEVKIVGDPKNPPFTYQSPHYEFVCDVALKVSIVREFSKMFEATYKVMQTLPLSFDRARDAPEGELLKVFLFETREGYIKNGGPPQSGGVYMPRTNVIMIPLTSLGVRKSGSQYAKKSGAENQTLAHEIVHQLQDRVYDKRGSLGWFTEGLAEYVSSSPYNSSGKFTFKGNLRDIAKSVMEYDYKKQVGSNLGKEITLKDLKSYMLQSYPSFTANGTFNYAMGMLITAYFIHMDDEGSRKNLVAFLKAMREGKEGEELLDTLLAGRTWEQLGKEISAGWRKYGMKLTITTE